MGSVPTMSEAEAASPLDWHQPESDDGANYPAAGTFDGQPGKDYRHSTGPRGKGAVRSAASVSTSEHSRTVAR